MNKKGGERILSFYWFIMFIIIGIGVVSGVLIFFSGQTDVRKVEASILADKIVECFVQDGKLINDNLNKINGDNLAGECGLYLQDNTYNDKEQYYISVKIERKNEAVGLRAGKEDYEAFCGQEQSKKNIPLCIRKRILVLDNNDFAQFEVVSSVRKVEQNAI